MNINRLKLLSLTLILTMLGNMVMLPLGAQAAPQLAENPAIIVKSGELLMTAAPQATGNALELAQRMAYIQQTGLENVAESTLIQARQNALETAQQAAQVQGAVGALVNGLTELGYQSQAAVDMDDAVADLNTGGFETELATALADFGLTSTQIDGLAETAAGNFNARRSPLPADTRTFLTDMGLTTTEIDQLEQALADYGLADTGLSTKLAQLQATQQEMSGVRTEALVIYLQLLTQQVFVRQQAGAPPRSMSTAEVEEVVNDQLRLLIHTAYLDALWGSNPDPEIGEGQWLFIERYSLRVAERLDALILETHNLGLLVDMLVALQLHSTALAALAGDAAYAQAEMDPLANFLAALLGDNGASGQGYRQASPPFWWAEALALGNYAPAGLTEITPDPAAVATAQAQAQTRIKGLAAPLWFPAAQGGAVTETNETNNQDEIVFATTFPKLPPDVLDQVMFFLQNNEEAAAIWRVLSGQTDNAAETAANITLSFYPITGIMLDIIALYTEPTDWGKAMAFIGLTASILTDGSEILATFGVAFPPALSALPVAAVGEAIDIGASVLRNVKALVSSKTYEIIRKIPFKSALELGVNIMGHLGRRVFELAGAWPASFDEAFTLTRNQLDSVWQPFVTLLDHYDQQGLGKLYKLGFGDGGFLAGRGLKKLGNASDEALSGVKGIGNDLKKAGYSFSDQAAAGLVATVDDIDEGATRRVLDFAGCLVGSLSYRGKVAGLASPLLDPDPECDVAKAVFEVSGGTAVKFSEPALKGMSNLVERNGKAFVENALQRMGQKGYSSEVINTTFAALDESLEGLSPGAFQWSDKAVDGLALMVKKAGDQTGNLNESKEIAKAILGRHGRAETANQIFQWLDDLGDINSPKYGNWVKGLAATEGNNLKAALFELRYSVELKKSSAVIDTLQDYKGNNQAMDLILAEGEERIWVELKNATSESVSKMKEQLEKRLGIRSSDIFYGPGNYEYVFAGPPNESYINALCNVTREAVNRGLLNDEQFAKFTIKFMNWPQSIEGLLQTTSLAIEPASVVGCRR